MKDKTIAKIMFAVAIVLAILLFFALRNGQIDSRINCPDFKYQEDAQDYFKRDKRDIYDLDQNNNGVACEILPKKPKPTPVQKEVTVPVVNPQQVSPTPMVELDSEVQQPSNSQNTTVINQQPTQTPQPTTQQGVIPEILDVILGGEVLNL